jgi:deazaflavin-dependent oxidoreductase (nitroreductase family)
MSAEPQPVRSEPLAAKLHVITRLTNRLQGHLVNACRRYFDRAPGWVLLTTRGRKSGLPREVLLPCERFAQGLIVISTYGRQANWLRNIERDAAVTVTCAGWRLPARAEVIDDVERKQSLITAHPFFAPLPVFPLNAIHRTLLRPLLVAFLRWWVRPRPVILIHCSSSPTV